MYKTLCYFIEFVTGKCMEWCKEGSVTPEKKSHEYELHLVIVNQSPFIK